MQLYGNTNPLYMVSLSKSKYHFSPCTPLMDVLGKVLHRSFITMEDGDFASSHGMERFCEFKSLIIKVVLR